MRIGVDVSQSAYEGTGVSEFIYQLVYHLVMKDPKNTYVFFFSSLRSDIPEKITFLAKTYKNIQIKQFKFPVTALDYLWNQLHIVPIEWFIGDIDVFLSSDWTQPPTIR